MVGNITKIEMIRHDMPPTGEHITTCICSSLSKKNLSLIKSLSNYQFTQNSEKENLYGSNDPYLENIIKGNKDGDRTFR